MCCSFPLEDPAAALELEEAISLWEKLGPRVVIPMHFRNEKCIFPKYDADDLMKLKPGAVRADNSEAEFTAGDLPSGKTLILNPTL